MPRLRGEPGRTPALADRQAGRRRDGRCRPKLRRDVRRDALPELPGLRKLIRKSSPFRQYSRFRQQVAGQGRGGGSPGGESFRTVEAIEGFRLWMRRSKSRRLWIISFNGGFRANIPQSARLAS
jgi:hypothetical protein